MTVQGPTRAVLMSDVTSISKIKLQSNTMCMVLNQCWWYKSIRTFFFRTFKIYWYIYSNEIYDKTTSYQCCLMFGYNTFPVSSIKPCRCLRHSSLVLSAPGPTLSQVFWQHDARHSAGPHGELKGGTLSNVWMFKVAVHVWNGTKMFPFTIWWTSSRTSTAV